MLDRRRRTLLLVVACLVAMLQDKGCMAWVPATTSSRSATSYSTIQRRTQRFITRATRKRSPFALVMILRMEKDDTNANNDVGDDDEHENDFAFWLDLQKAKNDKLGIPLVEAAAGAKDDDDDEIKAAAQRAQDDFLRAMSAVKEDYVAYKDAHGKDAAIQRSLEQIRQDEEQEAAAAKAETAAAAAKEAKAIDESSSKKDDDDITSDNNRKTISALDDDTEEAPWQ